MRFWLTHYCLCALCCGEVGNPTASGRMPQVGVTVAAPRQIPAGTWVQISHPQLGVIRRRVDDRTARRINGWDLLVGTHRQALNLGVQKVEITIIERPRRAPARE